MKDYTNRIADAIEKMNEESEWLDSPARREFWNAVAGALNRHAYAAPLKLFFAIDRLSVQDLEYILEREETSELLREAAKYSVFAADRISRSDGGIEGSNFSLFFSKLRQSNGRGLEAWRLANRGSGNWIAELLPYIVG